jgi:ABC-type phosphate transport system substrate-binding protein
VRFKKVTQTAVGAAVVIGSLAVGVGYAQADYAPSATDVIGISGVTPQVSFDFLADGDNQGDSGYNASNNPNKLVNFDATADLNGRNPYLQNSATSLNPTVVYRAGTSPVQRVRSTGNAYTAFAQDTGSQKVFNFIGAANAPTAAQQAAATPPNSLHVVQVGTDGVKIVASNTTNAPAGLTRAQLLGIYKGTYTAWNQIPGNAGGSSATIHPFIPPADSAINKALVNELTIENGGPFTLAAGVQFVEQNDPVPLAADANAIAPFATGRLNVWNTPGGYFKNPNTPFPGGSTISPGAKFLDGAPIGGGTSWSSTNGIYAVFRQADFVSTTKWQPGSAKNWVQTLFLDSTPGATPFVKKPAGQALLAASGITPLYVDKGVGYSEG